MHYKITIRDLNRLKAHLEIISKENTKLKSKSEGIKSRSLSNKAIEENENLIHFLNANFLNIKSN